MKTFFKFRFSFLGILTAGIWLFLGLNEWSDPEKASMIFSSLPWSIIIILLDGLGGNQVFTALLGIGVFVNSVLIYRAAQAIDEAIKSVLSVRIFLYSIVIIAASMFLFASINDYFLN